MHDAAQLCEIHASDGFSHVVEDDTPEPRVVLAHEAGSGGDRHMRHQRHGERLEQQREPGAFARPRHADLADAAFGARDARHARGEKRLMLKEIEMPPSLLGGVVHGTIVGVAARAGKA